MSKYLDIIPRCDCTACGACSAICPRNCIEMEEDCLGFTLPDVDSQRCIHCGLCEKGCPVLNFNPDIDGGMYATAVYAAKNRESDVALKSSSGGVFSILAEEILGKGGVVYGVAMSPELNAVHMRVESKEDISKIRGSKYLQSNAAAIYPSVKSDLRNGRHVLFSGVPCQIAGLRQYLRNDYERLLCVEVVCHGVPSNLAFRRYIEDLETKNRAKIVSVNFRDKRKGWQNYYITYVFDNGRRLRKRRTEDLYFTGYINNLFVRDNCTNCRFKGPYSNADIILGDMWGIESMQPTYDVADGVSMICINSATGNDVFKRIESRLAALIEVNYAEVEKYNPCISHSVTANDRRIWVMERLSDGEFSKPVKEALGISFYSIWQARYINMKIKLLASIIALKHFIRKS